MAYGSTQIKPNEEEFELPGKISKSKERIVRHKPSLGNINIMNRNITLEIHTSKKKNFPVQLGDNIRVSNKQSNSVKQSVFFPLRE